MDEKISKHIIFTKTHEDIVNRMIDSIPGVNSFSEAVRFAILAMENKTDQQQLLVEMRSKLNALSKNTDILVEMVAGGFNELNVNVVESKEKTYVYKDAVKIVEENIQRATTLKAEKRNSKQEYRRLFY